MTILFRTGTPASKLIIDLQMGERGQRSKTINYDDLLEPDSAAN